MSCNLPRRRFVPRLLAASLLAVVGCGEDLPPVTNEPPEVAELRAAGKKPWEIRAEVQAQALTKALKNSSQAGRRTN